MRTLINAINSSSSWLDRWTEKRPGRTFLAAAVMAVLIVVALCMHAAAIGHAMAAPIMGVQL